jgi:uridine kinase
MKPRVLGIAGGTASGKSTLAAALAERLGSSCQLLLHDRYYHPLPAAHAHDPAGYNFDAPASLDTARMVRDLDGLRDGQATRVPRYDFATHSRLAEEDLLEPRPVILVEGILVLSDAALRERFDHAIFVHTADDIRLMRRIRRDMAHRGRGIHDILAQYERTVRPMHVRHVEPSRAHADRVFDGTEPIESLVDQVLGSPFFADLELATV